MSQIKIEIPDEEIMEPGHVACPGCGATLSMRFALKIMGKRTVIVIPACCWSVIDGPFPLSAAGIPVAHAAFETAAATAAGVKAGLVARGDTETRVMAWAGDGGTFDIGIQALSAIAERNEDVLYVCYDNEAYMNTGIQRSSATPYKAWTTTTPATDPKNRPKKHLLDIMAAHRIPYAATATVAYPEDFMMKFRKAKEIRGMRLLHLLSPCPPGWKIVPDQSIRMARLAVQSRVFPLIEIENGLKYRITVESEGIPVREYLRNQGRFRHITEEDVKLIQKEVDRNWMLLQKKVEIGALIEDL
jgi:pyruvate/2-oxoacid:ferredoxin oxidoreductase beta subunit